MSKEEISEPSQDQKIVQTCVTDPLDMISNFTSNTNFSELKEEPQSEINHTIVPNYSDTNENHEVPYKKARIKEEKALVIKIEQNNCINEEASDAINSNSKSVFNEKEEISKESENGHCDIADQEIDIKTENKNSVDNIYKESLKKQETEVQELEQIGHCPKERQGPSFRCKYCWNTTVMNGRKKLKGNAMTKYFCPDCQVNLCIVPCFQAYHRDLEDVKFNGAKPNPSNDNISFENSRSDLEENDQSDICGNYLSKNIEKCVVPYCENQGFKGFSKFPTNTAEQESWMKSCGLSFLKSSFFICHNHFKESCFVDTNDLYKNKRSGLKKRSKPELLLPQVSVQPCFQAKYLEDVKLENFRSNGSIDPLDICDDKLESVHEKENCAEKYEIFENEKLLIDSDSNYEALKEDGYITITPPNNTKPLDNNFRSNGSNLGENDPLDICGDNLELVHEEKNSNTSINSGGEKWALLQCQFCDKKHFGKPELCMHNPSKHPEQNARKNVKMRLTLDKLRNDGLRIRDDDNNLQGVQTRYARK